jgi:diphthine-ammonia ligase
MFQTVGLSLLPLIAQSLRLPLYTRTITGKPLNVESEYGDRRGLADRDDGASSRLDGTLGDETEDLFALLSDIKVCPRPSPIPLGYTRDPRRTSLLMTCFGVVQ